jgi:hypothetical protein
MKLDLIMLDLLRLDLLRLDLMNTPERTESLDYEPSRGKKLLSGVVPEGLESHCRARVSQGQEYGSKTRLPPTNTREILRYA